MYSSFFSMRIQIVCHHHSGSACVKKLKRKFEFKSALPAHNSSIFSPCVTKQHNYGHNVFFPLQATENSSQKLLHMSMKIIDTIILTRVLESDWLLTRLLIPGNVIPLG